MSTTVLVTGGAGFIGSNLIDRLLLEGHCVVCLDNFDSFYDPGLKRKNIASALQSTRFVLEKGDIRDRSHLKKIFAAQKIDIVIHLAARAGVRPSLLDPELYYDVNVTGTLDLLEEMRNAGVTKMLFASSSSVYGDSSLVPFREDDSVAHPISPYAATKRSGELLCYTFKHLYDFDIWCLRFFSVYGPRQRPEMAIRFFTEAILDGRPITMFGDGTMLRDYTHIDDIVDGLMVAAQRVRGYEIINLGESHTISLKDLISVLEHELGKKAIICQLPNQPGDVYMTCADVKKASMLLDYTPTVSVRDGISSFVKWLGKQ